MEFIVKQILNYLYIRNFFSFNISVICMLDFYGIQIESFEK